MPDQYFKLANGEWAKFPDHYTPEQIQDNVRQLEAQLQAPKEPTVQSVMDNWSPVGQVVDIVKSGLKLGKNILWDMPKALGELAALDIELKDPNVSFARKKMIADQGVQFLKALPAALFDEIVTKRFGTRGRALETLTKDPLSVVSDIASLAGGAGLAAKAGGFARTAEAMNTVSKLDPVILGAKGAAKAVDEAGKVVIQGTVRPSAALKADFKMTGREAAQRIQDAGTSNLGQARAHVEDVSKAEDALATSLVNDPRKMDIGEVIDELDLGQPRTPASGHATGGSEKEETKLNKAIETMKRRNARQPPPEPPRQPIEVVDEGSAPRVETIGEEVPVAPPDAPPPLQLEDRIIYSAGQDGRVGPRLLNPAPPGVADPGMNIELHQRGFPGARRENVPPSSSTAEPIPMRESTALADEMRAAGMSEEDIARQLGVTGSTAMVPARPAAMAEVVDESTGLVRRPVRLGARGGRPPGPQTPLYEPLNSRDALDAKRAAQAKAAATGNAFTRTMEQAKAAKFKEGIANTWSEMGEAAEDTQKAISINRMFDDAELRKGTGLMPKLVSGAATGAPVAFFGGGPAGMATGAAMFGLHALSEAPEVGAKIGIAANRFHNFAMNPKLLRMAQLMRAAGARSEDIEAALEREAMQEQLRQGGQ